MNKVTLCLAYYNNNNMFLRQLEYIDNLPVRLQQNISMIVVDDCSPNGSASGLIEGLNYRAPKLKIFRMLVDIPWNQDACRNLAVDQADAGWVLLTDMDHIVSRKVWERVIEGKLDEKLVYKFGRVSEPAMEPYKQHPNSWLMTKKTFDRAGGYDERFRGWYGTDGDFRNHVMEVARIVNLKEPLIRVPREVTPDASTTTLERRSEKNAAALDRIKRGRAALPELERRPLRNQTPWARVL